jgi:hypothetical protein
MYIRNMAESSTQVKIGENSFDIAGVGDWVTANIWVFLLIAFVVFMFHIFQRGGFAEKYLEYRNKKRELEANQSSDLRKIIETLDRKFDGDEPWLPFERLDGPPE